MKFIKNVLARKEIILVAFALILRAEVSHATASDNSIRDFLNQSFVMESIDINTGNQFDYSFHAKCGFDKISTYWLHEADTNDSAMILGENNYTIVTDDLRKECDFNFYGSTLAVGEKNDPIKLSLKANNPWNPDTYYTADHVVNIPVTCEVKVFPKTKLFDSCSGETQLDCTLDGGAGRVTYRLDNQIRGGKGCQL